METCRYFLSLGLFLVAAAGAQAETVTYPTMEVGLDVSFPIQFATNSLATRSNAQSDFNVSPLLQVSVAGKINETIGYSVYGIGTMDGYVRVRDADAGLATLGAKLTKKSGDWVFGTSYERNNFFDGAFQNFSFVGNDLTGFAQYTFKNQGLTIKPTFASGYRIADDISQDRGLLSAKVDIEQLLTKELSAVATARLRYYLFTEAANSGRRDLLATGSLGLKYSFSDDVSWTTTVGFERRVSNVFTREYSNFVVLSGLDISQVLMKIR